ncbi:MAG TPA: hypothetical protein DCZ94_21590 [Lentisphaeria bacterium]|nr:MAG: hypothetical protein A2X48_14520 [Lentisphaerae bacterium GWF2_49_21]HBC89539.1 hypothetical protein [Lentisphaeria bacterium]
MRETPLHITIALHRHDPLLDLKWDDSCKRWMIHYRDRAIFAYRHPDGVPATDPVESELMAMIQKYDWLNRDKMLGETKRIKERIASSVNREKDGATADAGKESANIADFYRRDCQPKPFIPPIVSKPITV